jgi:predicted Fe-Mo cluster-binding NifX family protein
MRSKSRKGKERGMKLCISSTKNDMDASVDPRFGRCQYFLFVDAGTMAFEVLGNPAFTAGGGAGIQAAQAVVNKGANAVITGNVGPNAFQALEAGGVKIITGARGTVKDVVERFNKGEYEYAASPSVETHYGSGR